MKYKVFKKTLAMLLVFALAMNTLIVSTSANLITRATTAKRTLNLGTGGVGWNNITPGSTRSGTTEVHLYQGDHVNVNITFTFSGTLSPNPGNIRIEVLNVLTNVTAHYDFTLSRSGATINATRIFTAPQNGAYKFRIKNTLNVTASANGSYSYSKSPNPYSVQGGLASRNVRIQRIQGSSVTNDAWTGVWAPAILESRDYWNTCGAGVNITTTTATEPHTLTVESRFGVTWDGRATKDPLGSNVIAPSSQIIINTIGPNNLGSLGGTSAEQTRRNRLRKAVIAHEIGHLFWLVDINSPTRQSIMSSGYVLNSNIYTPQLYDIKNVRFLYD